MKRYANTLAALITLAFLWTGTVSAGTIYWAGATDIATSSDVLNSGSLVEAVNSASGVGTLGINGVTFTNGLPIGGAATGLFSGSTGNANYDTLLDSVVNGGGAGLSSISIGGGSLTVGNAYRVQVWFTDDRVGTKDRVMRFGDGDPSGIGNFVDLAASATETVGVPGQYVVGTFIATGTSQTLTMDPQGFGNSHINAYQLRDGNLVTNGSFEPDGEFDFVPDNWNVTGQVFNAGPTRSNIQTRDPNASATDGDTLLQLNGGGLAPGGAINQDLATITGAVYELTFDFDKNGGGSGTASLDIDVTVGSGTGGASLLDQTVTDAVANTLSSYTFQFVATSNVTNLRFLDSTAGAASSFDGRLDNIRVEFIDIPTPAAFPAGLAMLGLVAARRRRR